MLQFLASHFQRRPQETPMALTTVTSPTDLLKVLNGRPLSVDQTIAAASVLAQAELAAAIREGIAALIARP